ncbi:MAG: enoyl-CoA hydratase/isomerase family protein [Pirellula sp.]|jgi:methylglutaconyl-CoA hydratase
MPESVGIEIVKRGIAVVTLQRPERRNALSIGMMNALIQGVGELVHAGKARVAILRGDGPVFCAGLDLAEASDPQRVVESANCVASTLRSLRYTPLVTIAAVHGGAYAGGAGVMAACDMAVGADNVQIGFPEARRGLLPALISDVLRSKVREGDLAELFLVGNTISAQRAQQIGLLQRVVAPEAVLEEALRMADGILAGGPQTIIDTKSLLHNAYDRQRAATNSAHMHPQESHDEHASIEEHLKARNSPEAQEGLKAFLEKRLPSWMVD